MEIYGHSKIQLDEKNRIRIPTSFKESLGDHPFMFIGPHRTIYLMDNEGYMSFKKQLAVNYTEKSAAAARLINMYSFEITFDAQGRVLIPAVLVKYAGLEKDCYIIGNNGRAELWTKDRFEEFELENLNALDSVFTQIGLG